MRSKKNDNIISIQKLCRKSVKAEIRGTRVRVSGALYESVTDSIDASLSKAESVVTDIERLEATYYGAPELFMLRKDELIRNAEDEILIAVTLLKDIRFIDDIWTEYQKYRLEEVRSLVTNLK